jgi:hypothetical protein
MARTKFSELRKQPDVRSGSAERLAAKRAETLEEIRLYELRHREAISQAELVAVFDDDDRRVPVHLGKDSAA